MECAQVLALQRACGIFSRATDHFRQRHSEAKKFGHRRQQIESRTIDAKRVDIARNAIRHELLSKHRAPCPESERTHAVTDVEDDAALACSQHVWLDLAVDRCRC